MISCGCAFFIGGRRGSCVRREMWGDVWTWCAHWIDYNRWPPILIGVSLLRVMLPHAVLASSPSGKKRTKNAYKRRPRDKTDVVQILKCLEGFYGLKDRKGRSSVDYQGGP